MTIQVFVPQMMALIMKWVVNTGQPRQEAAEEIKTLAAKFGNQR